MIKVVLICIPLQNYVIHTMMITNCPSMKMRTTSISMCSIVMATTPQEHEHTIWFVLSVVSIGCTDNPFNGMKPASDLSSHKGTDAPVVMATGNKRAQGITLNCYSNMNTICTYVPTYTHTHIYIHTRRR